MKANLLNCIGNIRGCQGKVLKSNCKAPVIRSIRNEITIRSGKLGLSLNRRQGWMTFSHASTLKEVTISYCHWERNIL
jgi:hypothetical protein